MRHSAGSARDKHSQNARRRFDLAGLLRCSKPGVVGSTLGGKRESDSPESRSDECGQSLWAARAERSGARTPSLQCHRTLLAAASIIFPAESDAFLIEGQQAVIGNGYAMGVAT